MYGDGCVRIERAENGYTVRARDPKIVAKNAAREIKSDYRAPYLDPDREYVFTTVDQVMAFLKANLDKALPKEDYSSSFEAISAEDGAD